MKTVICFDSWTQGARHAVRLVPAMQRLGMRLILVHVGSWGHETDRPDEEWIDGLLVRDVRYYAGLDFEDILRREQPAAVLFLSIQAFAHRTFNRYCRRLNIPTAHLYHGVVNVQATTAKRQYEVNLRLQLEIFAGRIRQNAGTILPRYLKSLVETCAPVDDWIWLIKDVWRKLAGTSYDGTAAPDTQTDICGVYTAADVPHAQMRYGIPVERIFVAGNPDLVAFGLSDREMGVLAASREPKSREIIYIDTALIEAGAVFDDADDFVEHLVTSAGAVREQGYQFAVKLHPAHYRTGVPERLRERGIPIVEGTDLIERLLAAAGALTEPSSAALIPALLGLPVLLVQYGKLADQRYGSVLTSYPRVRRATSLASIDADISSAFAVPMAPIEAWIAENAGPLPAEEMPDRVARNIAHLISTGPVTGECGGATALG